MNIKTIDILNLRKIIFISSLSSSLFAIDSTNTANLTTNNIFYRPTSSASFTAQASPSDFTPQNSNSYSYISQALGVQVTGTYDITTTGNKDSFLILYSSFDKDNPTNNIIVGNDDAGTDYNALLDDVLLTQGQSYYLVVTTYQANETGAINFLISGPGSITYNVLTTPISYAEEISENANNATQSAATALDTIRNTNDTQMDNIFLQLDTIGNSSERAQRIEETTPQTTTGDSVVTNYIVKGISNIVTQRQHLNLGLTGLNSGDETLNNKNIWFKPFGSMGTQKDKDGINGFDISTYGLAFGFDKEFYNNTTLGFGIFYTNAYVDINNVSQKSKLDVYAGVIYGSVPIIDDKTKFMYQVGYSIQKTSSYRDIELTNQTAKGKYISKMASVDLKILRDYKISDKMIVQPMISTIYRYFRSPSYSESGAGVLNLNVNRYSTNELLVGLGTMAHYKVSNEAKFIGSINIDYNLHNKQNIVNSSYQGASGVNFETKGIDNGRWSYDLGIGYERSINDIHSFKLSYNFQGEGDSFTNNIFSARYTYSF